MLAILVAEDIVIAVVLGFARAAAAASARTRSRSSAKAIGFIAASLAVSKWLSGPIDRLLRLAAARDLPARGLRASSSAWLRSPQELGLSEAIGALMAGVVLSETSVREEIEERFFSFRDVFAALFFFVFGLSIDVGTIGSVGWLLAARRRR